MAYVFRPDCKSVSPRYGATSYSTCSKEQKAHFPNKNDFEKVKVNADLLRH
jgi:hypothetical protein